MKRIRKNYFDFSRFIRSRHKKYKSPVYGFSNVEVERYDKKNHLNKNNDLLQPLGSIDYKVVGHSAGGSTIQRLGHTGDLCKISPSMVVWSDSSYGTWLDQAWRGCLSKNSHIRVKVLVAKWDSPYKNATRFMKQFGKNMQTDLGPRSIAQLSKIHAAHSLGASKWQILRYVIFPNSLPEILTGIRVATGMCWGTLVAAEFFS